MLQSFTAEVSRLADLAHDVREIEARLLEPGEIVFLPGQFVAFKVPKPGTSSSVNRLYSIASPPREREHVLLLLDFVPGGPGSTYLFGLREGDRTQFKGPAGAFYLHDEPRDLLFVATGTGIAALRPMFLTALDEPPDRSITLFWGLRTERDLYYQDQLESLAARHSNFSFTTTLSQPSGAWKGATGRVTRLVENRIDSVTNLSAYLCGSSAMIGDVTAVLEAKGPCPIYREQYFVDPP
jgi:CDP-4-dehydro-6-deoxyglucose reductase